MENAGRGDVTQLLQARSRGDAAAADLLWERVYDEMRRFAARVLKDERPGHSLSPSDLVNLAYLRLVDATRIQDRTEFFRLAIQAMRRILVDHARRRSALKRPGKRLRLEMREDIALANGPDIDLLALEEALDALALLHQRRSQALVMRFYGGLEVLEIAQALGVSKRTIEDDLTVARAWLRGRLAGGEKNDAREMESSRGPLPSGASDLARREKCVAGWGMRR